MSVEEFSFDDHFRKRLRNYPQTPEFQRLYDKWASEIKQPQTKLRVPVVILFIGIPGSGKSTISNLLQESTPAIPLRSDFIGLERLPKCDDYYKAYMIQEALARKYLGEGFSVILDDNYRTRYNRQQIYHLASEFGARNILFRLHIPVDIAAARVQQKEAAEKPEDIRTIEEIIGSLYIFRDQIEEVTKPELDRFQVLYRRIDATLPLSQIRKQIEDDTDLQRLINPRFE